MKKNQILKTTLSVLSIIILVGCSSNSNNIQENNNNGSLDSPNNNNNCCTCLDCSSCDVCCDCDNPYLNNNSENSSDSNNDNVVDDNLTIKLTEKNHSISFNNNAVKLNFKGTESTDFPEQYEYNLYITINNKNIKNNLFTKEKYIWSENCAATFEFFEFENHYFFKSFIAKENNGNWILITDKQGNIIKEFYDVSFKINKNSKSIEIEECNKDNCSSKTYNLTNGKLSSK